MFFLHCYLFISKIKKDFASDLFVFCCCFVMLNLTGIMGKVNCCILSGQISVLSLLAHILKWQMMMTVRLPDPCHRCILVWN